MKTIDQHHYYSTNMIACDSCNSFIMSGDDLVLITLEDSFANLHWERVCMKCNDHSPNPTRRTSRILK